MLTMKIGIFLIIYPNFVGDPALLHSKIRDSGLDMSNVEQCSLVELRALATDIRIPCANKSRVYSCMAL